MYISFYALQIFLIYRLRKNILSLTYVAQMYVLILHP